MKAIKLEKDIKQQRKINKKMTDLEIQYYQEFINELGQLVHKDGLTLEQFIKSQKA